MKRPFYTVAKRNGRWGIRASDAPFFECDSYREALEISLGAAAVLAREPSSGATLGGAGLGSSIEGGTRPCTKGRDGFVGQFGRHTHAEEHFAATSSLAEEEGLKIGSDGERQASDCRITEIVTVPGDRRQGCP